ncbi:MAG: DNA-protecting protein DprA [Methanobacteriota archaeon]|nr:MAG: DNA-protecting protein DprA [Euryarchaeota archaeon]
MAQRDIQIEELLLLLTVPMIGPGRIRRLLSVFDSVNEIFRAPIQRLQQIDGIDAKLATQLKSGGDRTQVDKQLQLMEQHGISCLSIWDEQYPELLKNSFDPPVVLFYKGKIPEPWPPIVAVVGTRLPSAYGKMVTEKLVSELVNEGIAIVSGLARGIDTIAHQISLKRGGKTYAVLGCGVDYVYPPENRKLYEAIQQEGALFSEYFIGTQPDAGNFPRRNRIISGMSLGVLVVEAGEKSGALITAANAVEQNREVFAVPGNINNPKSKGTNRLIQQGAKLVTSVDDILEEIHIQIKQKQAREKPLPPNLNALERQLLEHLTHEPKHIDKLVSELKESPSAILSRLLTLELMGLVKQLSGKMFVRVF